MFFEFSRLFILYEFCTFFSEIEAKILIFPWNSKIFHFFFSNFSHKIYFVIFTNFFFLVAIFHVKLKFTDFYASWIFQFFSWNQSCKNLIIFTTFSVFRILKKSWNRSWKSVVSRIFSFTEKCEKNPKIQKKNKIKQNCDNTMVLSCLNVFNFDFTGKNYKTKFGRKILVWTPCSTLTRSFVFILSKIHSYLWGKYNLARWYPKVINGNRRLCHRQSPYVQHYFRPEMKQWMK